ncbi:MAG: type VI secretion system baseplate subunit TssG [Planctomycetales bacterium]
MADETRTEGRHLEFLRKLQETPYQFGFFQALRRLECVHRDKPRLGQSKTPADDPVRLGQRPSMAFAPSTLADYQVLKGRPRLRQYFLGLFGPNGAVPLHLTEYARDRIANDKDRTLSAFADVFHHRMLGFFYRARADAHPTVQFDRPEEDRFAEFVGSLCGLGYASLRDRDDMPDLAKLFFSGHLGCQTRHSEGLQSILEYFFSIKTEIISFHGHWLSLPEDAQLRLGDSPETGSLGLNTVVGSRVWDCQYMFQVVFGPMNLAEYERLLPGGDSLKRLQAIVRNYTGDELICEVKLILKKEEVPDVVLGKSGVLGRTTWLKSKPLAKDADDFRWRLGVV